MLFLSWLHLVAGCSIGHYVLLSLRASRAKTKLNTQYMWSQTSWSGGFNYLLDAIKTGLTIMFDSCSWLLDKSSNLKQCLHSQISAAWMILCLGKSEVKYIDMNHCHVAESRLLFLHQRSDGASHEQTHQKALGSDFDCRLWRIETLSIWAFNHWKAFLCQY